MSAPRRNVELKATDPDPARSLAICLDLGADDCGVIVQRDTYFRVRNGRLKLREESPGGAALIQYDRADAAEARESRYRIAPVSDPGALREALDAAFGTLVVVSKERHLLLWQDVRIHLDRVEGLGDFVELEGVAPAESDLEPERDKVAQLSQALGLDESRIVADSYSDRLPAALQGGGPPAGDAARDDLLEAARRAMERAYAPYSNFRVGVALRAEDGSIHVGANVENAAYPQGWCAETSAIGALIAAGHHRVEEAAVIGDGNEPCVPCGGCRQRLREFMALDAPVHVAAVAGARDTTTLGALFPRSFGPEFLA